MVLYLITDVKRMWAQGLVLKQVHRVNFNCCIILVLGKDDSPYYTYLGAAPNLDSLRNLLEDR